MGVLLLPDEAPELRRRMLITCTKSGRALDVLHGVYRQDVFLRLQCETEFAQDREDCGEAGEGVRGIRTSVRWRRGQPRRNPAFRVYGEPPAERCAVHDWQVRPVTDVIGKVVHIYGFCIQGMAQAANKVMASFRVGIKGARLRGNGRLLELRSSAGYRESVNWHRFILNPHDESETAAEQSSNHLLNSGSHFSFLKTRRDCISGRFRFDIVPLTKSPFGKTRKTWRRVYRHVVRVTQERDHRDRTRNQVTAGKRLQAPVPLVGRAGRLYSDRYK
jgi:hypothetical protein